MSSYRGRRKNLIFSQLDGSFVGRRAGNGFGKVLFWGVREEHLVTTILEKNKSIERKAIGMSLVGLRSSVQIL